MAAKIQTSPAGVRNTRSYRAVGGWLMIEVSVETVSVSQYPMR